jgi:DNA-directed RNA polymerase specialized sigma24 family protein
LSELLKIVSEKHNDWIRIVKSFGELDFHEDIVQEMYLKVHANKDKDVWFRNDKLNTPYVYSILHNIFYDLKKSKGKVLKVDVSVLENFSDNDLNFDIEKNELNKIIDSEIQSWDFYDQKLYEVYTIHEKSIRKIHKATGISVRSIHTTLTNCKNRIVERVNNEMK